MARIRNAVFLAVVSVLAATVAGAAEWRTDYDKSLSDAKTARKCVLIDFSGSDWCGPCIALKKNVFDQPEFAAYAGGNLVLLDIDYPRDKVLPEALRKQNENLKHQYRIDKLGYPTVVLLGPDGKVLGQFTGYGDEGPAEIIARLNKFMGK
jgi:thioredoxin-related protein